jgi:hypothetical protein
MKGRPAMVRPSDRRPDVSPRLLSSPPWLAHSDPRAALGRVGGCLPAALDARRQPARPAHLRAGHYTAAGQPRGGPGTGNPHPRAHRTRPGPQVQGSDDHRGTVATPCRLDSCLALDPRHRTIHATSDFHRWDQAPGPMHRAWNEHHLVGTSRTDRRCPSERVWPKLGVWNRASAAIHSHDRLMGS